MWWRRRICGGGIGTKASPSTLAAWQKINEIDKALEKLNDNIKTFEVHFDDTNIHIQLI